MLICSSCGHESPDSFRFCPSCATPLDRLPSAAREERKVVTVLFADLVGFTSRSEQLDPEDVRRLLTPYHARLRDELERHGGTVEKFIGDAVMAVFGAPSAHEDDPERAVRAAIAIRSWIAEEQSGLQVRIGVNTGETIVNLAARPEAGEGMVAGDVVNTAARLQSAAPVDGILVGSQTYEATKHIIDYADATPVAAKGKVEPVPAWSVLAARSTFGVDVAQAARTPLVGRDGDLRLLVDTLARVRRERSPQLITLVGVPGMGKSRLVYELMQQVERDAELITWRQGRCLSYGEGVSYWALGEVVKAESGILETDAPEQARAKLHAAVIAVGGAHPGWVESHLSPLVGLTPDGDLGGDRRTESFAAWREFLEGLAEQRPLVLVLEDLQWADDGMLDFVDHLVDWAGNVPLLVVATARPELLTRRPGWGGGKANAGTVSLSALTDDQTAQLVHALLERSVLPAEAQAAVLARAGGNPLYAEEFARLYRERGSIDDTAMPESVQGIIAARLDLLSSEVKALAQAAAVLGKVFWLGAVASVSGRERWSIEQGLHDLERRELIRRERRGSVEGEVEYAFRHLLVRDVAYAQIPRGERAGKHRAAANWIESLGRPDDHAEMVAHHYLHALELSRAAGLDEGGLVDPAREALRAAGVRALSLNAWAAAADLLGHAVALWPADDRDHSELLLEHGTALHHLGDDRVGDIIAEAREGLVARGDLERAARADALLSVIWWDRGLRDRSFEHLDRAVALIAERPVSPDKLFVLNRKAMQAAIAGETDDAMRMGEEALAGADYLDLDEHRMLALAALGAVGWRGGESGGGVEAEQRALELAIALNSPEAARLYNNLAFEILKRGDARRAAEFRIESRATARRFGDERFVRFARGVEAEDAFIAGRWAEFDRLADAFIAECESGSPHYLESAARGYRSLVRLARDEVAGAERDAAAALELVREVKDQQIFDPVVASSIRLNVELGRLDAARVLAEEFVPTINRGSRVDGLTGFAWVAAQIGMAEALRERLDEVEPSESLWLTAQREILDERFEDAAATFDEIGAVRDTADARLRAGQALDAEGRHAEATVQYERALDFYRAVGATRYIRLCEQSFADTA